jgi:hypothetical protein
LGQKISKYSIFLIEEVGFENITFKKTGEENKKQFFQDYKLLIAIVADVISELDPKFEYPHSLATSLFEMANDHISLA